MTETPWQRINRLFSEADQIDTLIAIKMEDGRSSREQALAWAKEMRELFREPDPLPFVRESDGWLLCTVCNGRRQSVTDALLRQQCCHCQGAGYRPPEPYWNANPYPMR